MLLDFVCFYYFKKTVSSFRPGKGRRVGACGCMSKTVPGPGSLIDMREVNGTFAYIYHFIF